MIYEKDGLYYLKNGNDYEIANIELKYNKKRKKNILVITGTNIIKSLEEPITEYSFKDLEKEILK